MTPPPSRDDNVFWTCIAGQSNAMVTALHIQAICLNVKSMIPV
jgi:hypothetical protein